MADSQRERGPSGQFLPQPVDLPVDPGSGGTAGAKVTVACKLPWGLSLRVGDFQTENEPVMGGGVREVQVWRPRPGRVIVKGNRAPFGTVPDWPIVGGYGLTHNVDKDFWDKWKLDNAKHPLVIHNLILAFEEPGKTEEAARDPTNAARKSGLEGLDPDHLPPTGNPNIRLERTTGSA